MTILLHHLLVRFCFNLEDISRQCFVDYPNTSNFDTNTTPRIEVSTLSVFEYPDGTLPLVFDILHGCYFKASIVTCALVSWAARNACTSWLISSTANCISSHPLWKQCNSFTKHILKTTLNRTKCLCTQDKFHKFIQLTCQGKSTLYNSVTLFVNKLKVRKSYSW